jgi:hypothetical protein
VPFPFGSVLGFFSALPNPIIVCYTG